MALGANRVTSSDSFWGWAGRCTPGLAVVLLGLAGLAVMLLGLAVAAAYLPARRATASIHSKALRD